LSIISREECLIGKKVYVISMRVVWNAANSIVSIDLVLAYFLWLSRYEFMVTTTAKEDFNWEFPWESKNTF
jgi:hypothetical protein